MIRRFWRLWKVPVVERCEVAPSNAAERHRQALPQTAHQNGNEELRQRLQAARSSTGTTTWQEELEEVQSVGSPESVGGLELDLLRLGRDPCNDPPLNYGIYLKS